MQRRDARGFLEQVLEKIPDLNGETSEKLLALIEEKSGTKRAAKIAAVLQEAGDDE